MNKRYQSNMYKRVEQLDEQYLKAQASKVKKDQINYPLFHIAPAYGLLNDPNGLAFYNGEYHIFYQWCPNQVAHGMKNWNHLTTTDFINFKDHGIKLKPEYDFENYGIYSGGAKVINQMLHLFYTGNRRIESQNYKRVPTQCYAIMDQNYQIIKKEVLIDADDTLTEHFRDPSPLTINGQNIVIIGAQSESDKKARIIIYDANDDFSKLSNKRYLNESFGLEEAYMYECPTYITDKEHEALIFSPQGVKSDDKYQFKNANSVVYAVSYSGDIVDAKYDSKQIYELDYGFDFYAPQAFIDDKGRNILIGWLGHAQTIYPGEIENGWSQMLSIPREVTIKDGRIYQKPLVEYQKLRSIEHLLVNGHNPISSKTFELELKNAQQFTLTIGNQNKQLKLYTQDDEIIFDRSQMQTAISSEYGAKRYIKVDEPIKDVQVIVDRSSIEIFINDGKYVMSSRYCIDSFDYVQINGFEQGKYYQLSNITIERKES